MTVRFRRLFCDQAELYGMCRLLVPGQQLASELRTCVFDVIQTSTIIRCSTLCVTLLILVAFLC